MTAPVPDPLNPTVAEFDDFKDVPDTQDFLNWARDLFILDTGISDVSGLTVLEQGLVRRAILHMAWYIEEDHASREAYFSQFNSERIGSYYYSKLGTASRSKGVDPISVPAYDYAVDYFNRHSGDTTYADLWATTTSEDVFPAGFNEFGYGTPYDAVNDIDAIIGWPL